MGKSRNLKPGDVFGRLTLVKIVGRKKNRNMWLCKCDCGGEKTVNQNNFRNKIVSQHNLHYRRSGVKSCGCLLRENGKNMRLPFGEAAFNCLYARIRCDAKKRGLRWDVSKETVRELTQKPCHYCGIEPYQKERSKGKTNTNAWNNFYIYNGLDRTNNDQGYVAENLVPCCGICNHHKSNMSIEDFRAWVLRVYEHYIKPNGESKILSIGETQNNHYHRPIIDRAL